MAPSSPTVANWALGRRLRDLREQSGLTASKASKHIGITSAYLSEIEHGKKAPAKDRLDTFVDVYGVDPGQAGELHTLRGEAAQRGWWSHYSALFSDDLLRFFGYEQGAESMRTYDGGVVNGLLQTEDYARAIMEAGRPNIRLAEVDRRLQCRMLRQKRVTGEDPLHLSVVMSEAVLWQQVGGPDVLATQLEHLARLIDDHPDTLDARVVPFEATGHDSIGGSPFLLMTFPSGTLPTLLWQETVTSTQLISNSLTVREHTLAHTEAAKAALSREDSLEAITKASAAL